MSRTPEEQDITTIQIKKATRDELKKLGMKGETYDAIIGRLLVLAKKSSEAS